MEALRYAIIPVAVSVLIPILFTAKNKTTTKILVILLSLIVTSSLIPLYPLDGKSNNLVSIFDFIFKRGNNAFAVMVVSYLISLILLAVPGHKLDKVSLGIYTIGYFSSWWGLFTGDFKFIVYPPDEYGQFASRISFLWLLLYVLIPMINFLFYIPLVSSEKEKRKAITQISKSKM